MLLRLKLSSRKSNHYLSHSSHCITMFIRGVARIFFKGVQPSLAGQTICPARRMNCAHITGDLGAFSLESDSELFSSKNVLYHCVIYILPHLLHMWGQVFRASSARRLEVCEHQCGDDIERFYYIACPNDILCIHCGGVKNLMENEDGVYPIFSACINKGKVYKRESQDKTVMFSCMTIY